MLRIVPLIASLQEHLDKLLCTPEDYRPRQCPRCGLAGLWCHGHYTRKADRQSGKLNPIPVPRYYCPGCEGTCSRLPSCIAPRRWYLWSVQQAVLLCLLSGTSLRKCADTLACLLGPSGSTVRRWWRWLQARHDQFAFHLRNHQPQWGRAAQWQQFWQLALQEEPLRELMAYLDGLGLTVP
jgi:transposase-like protein